MSVGLTTASLLVRLNRLEQKRTPNLIKMRSNVWRKPKKIKPTSVKCMERIFLSNSETSRRRTWLSLYRQRRHMHSSRTTATSRKCSMPRWKQDCTHTGISSVIPEMGSGFRTWDGARTSKKYSARTELIIHSLRPKAFYSLTMFLRREFSHRHAAIIPLRCLQRTTTLRKTFPVKKDTQGTVCIVRSRRTSDLT